MGTSLSESSEMDNNVGVDFDNATDDSLPSLIVMLNDKSLAVTVPSEVALLLRDARSFMREEFNPSGYVSDRRLFKTLRALRVAAAATGRQRVSPLDCLLLQHILWYSPDQQSAISDWLYERIVPYSDLQGLEYLVTGILDRLKEALKNTAESEDVSESLLLDSKELKLVQDVLEGKYRTISVLAEECRTCQDWNLWFTETELMRVKQELAPRATDEAGAVRRLLEAVVQLRAVVSVASGRGTTDRTDTEVDTVGSCLRAASSPAEVLSDIWSSYVSKGADDGKIVKADEGSAKTRFTSSELALSKREAQKKFTAEEFKLWKKAQRERRGNGASEE